jgi:Mrp family chromosome partitioning ATPase
MSAPSLYIAADKATREAVGLIKMKLFNDRIFTKYYSGEMQVPTKEQVMDCLESIIVPDVMRSMVEMNLVRDVSVSDSTVEIKLAASAINEDTQDWLQNKTEEMTGKLEGVTTVKVSFESIAPKELNKITHVIAIMSGKGGVGKSLVSGLTAIALRRRGFSVGILDADITGPSIPKMFGIHPGPNCSENGILPLSSKTGIEVMSVNLLLPDENEAVIWRGPVIARVITQFWEEVLWGQLDYLIVDLPPGTADAPLTVLQQIPVSGIIIVSSPQDLATMIVKKAVNMARTLNKPIAGVVENMSYFYVPEINKKIELFGKSKGEEMAKAAGAPLLARLPIDPELAKLCDSGEIERYNSEDLDKLGEALSGLELSSTEECQGCNSGQSECKSCSHDCHCEE